ncbi:MAG TPA: Arm DNA-binding domain-containing protein, partial [Flavobacteriaceae bacterium]|nr:Arm DNA-binding domain-containing protein [Flavobacteriaceae bacterium]
MNNEVSILFYIKRAKANKEGLAPIYVRITVLAKRFELSTNRFSAVEKWSTEGSKVKGFSEEARSINNYLDELRIKIVNAEKSLVKRDIPVTSENLKNELLGITERNRTLIPIFQDHNNRIEALLGQEYAP